MVLMDDLVKDVGDFLFAQVTRMDIGVGDIRSGTLEIEAKLGTIIDKRTNSRVSTLGTSNTILHHAITGSGNLRFESFMTEVSNIDDVYSRIHLANLKCSFNTSR